MTKKRGPLFAAPVRLTRPARAVGVALASRGLSPTGIANLRNIFPVRVWADGPH
jgi:hypothetical protein